MKRTNKISGKYISFITKLAVILLFAHIDIVNAVLISGWESEGALVELKQGHEWPPYYAYPYIAFNLRDDGKWVLISNCDVNSRFFGYYYDDTENEWVEDTTLINGLIVHGWHEPPALAYNVTGDSTWTLITRYAGFHGYYWDGTTWIEDPKRVNGLPNISGRSSHTLIQDLTSDGKWTLITGTEDGTFRAFYWEGSQWIEDSSRVNGLPDMGSRSVVTAGFNIFGDNEWNIIAGSRSSTSLRSFYWNGVQWHEDSTKAAGLTTSLPELVPSLGYNLRGDGKWVLISGVGQTYTLLGFFYNSIETSTLPLQTDIISYHPLATTVRIKFFYPYTWNHRIKYSFNPDMSNASWSNWFEDMDSADVKVEYLIPDTTYYYEVYTYVPWDTLYYVQSSVYSFTTISAQDTIVVEPGESIQDAIEMLPLQGGVVELAPGVHDIYTTIVINRNNITIQGTHNSKIRVHDRDKPCFVIPHENPSPEEPWHTMPVIENLTFKGFKITSSYTGWRGNSLVLAWNVKNITVEDILDESYLADLVAINPTGGYTTAHSEDVFVKNNNCFQSEIVFCFSKNIHVIGNTITQATTDGIDINRNNEYVYIYDNEIYGGGNYNIRGHGGNYIYIENNVLLGGTQRCIYIDGLSNVLISNNILTGSSWAAVHIEPQSPRKNVTIINNCIYNNDGHGIWTSQYSYGFVEEISDVDLINNVICNNGGNGIEMTSEWVQFKNISNNIIINNGGYGINYMETVEPTIIKYNDLWNNSFGDYNGISSGTGDISVDPIFADSSNGDFHLKSEYGRWDGSTWVYDNTTSPCIDAGDAADDYSNELEPNGGRINMGAFGNTPEASKSSEFGVEIEIYVYPNPYQGDQGWPERITFGNLPAQTTIRIYTLSGDLVKLIEHDAETDGGEEEWDISDVKSGVYIYTVKSQNGKKVGKVSIIK